MKINAETAFLWHASGQNPLKISSPEEEIEEGKKNQQRILKKYSDETSFQNLTIPVDVSVFVNIK